MNRRLQPTYPAVLAALLACLPGLVGPVAAHNGAVALAYPVDGITVDGDLSAWPEGLGQYPISYPILFYNPYVPLHSKKPIDERDHRGAFRLAYNVEGNALFLGVEVQDESI